MMLHETYAGRLPRSRHVIQVELARVQKLHGLGGALPEWAGQSLQRAVETTCVVGGAEKPVHLREGVGQTPGAVAAFSGALAAEELEQGLGDGVLHRAGRGEPAPLRERLVQEAAPAAPRRIADGDDGGRAQAAGGGPERGGERKVRASWGHEGVQIRHQDRVVLRQLPPRRQQARPIALRPEQRRAAPAAAAAEVRKGDRRGGGDGELVTRRRQCGVLDDVQHEVVAVPLGVASPQRGEWTVGVELVCGGARDDGDPAAAERRPPGWETPATANPSAAQAPAAWPPHKQGANARRTAAAAPASSSSTAQMRAPTLPATARSPRW
eukprot:CAMPEP_0170276758 /NCGR_PEP_ID=MMETSP0116_2-20130129/38365_1 /TAXON_ID=400756 /ORGANISM="Durinskia baltica, Strain CSIRO CS-38" /LENGTH=324 /DNA_ID=CAMNT_0010528033 /DNA_START=48 /DNA_END=1019 /DNA_ORIENTATION=-